MAVAINVNDFTANKLVAENNDTYFWKRITVRGNVYTVMEVIAAPNSLHNTSYVSVRKDTNNPFRKVLGNEYENWDAALAHYKSTSIKDALKAVREEFKKMFKNK